MVQTHTYLSDIQCSSPASHCSKSHIKCSAGLIKVQQSWKTIKRLPSKQSKANATRVFENSIIQAPFEQV